MAVKIPLGVILIWTGLEADIPAGWVRTASLDDKFPKSYGLALINTTGGNATHTHNATAPHGHTMLNHAHDYQLSTVYSQSSNSTNASGTEAPPGFHSHSGSADVAGSGYGELSSVAATYGAVSNNPPHREVIFIEPDTVPADLNANITALWADPAGIPASWAYHDGLSSAVDLRNKFLRGAPAATDAGLLGGSNQNVHPLTHTHVEADHYHQGTSGGCEASGGLWRAQSGSNRLGNHTHLVTLGFASAGSVSSESLTTSEIVEPAHKKLGAIKNATGGISQPRFLIGMWLGDPSLVPGGWTICDGALGTPVLNDLYVKIANTIGEIGGTGGSNTHTHAAQSHGHTGGTHTHVGQNTNSHTGQNHSGPVGGNRDLQDEGAAHSVISVSSVAAAWAPSNTASDSANNEPQHRTVAYIQYGGVIANDQRNAEIRGQVAVNSQRNMELIGVEPSEERRAEVTGQILTDSERGAEIAGMIEWTREEKPELEAYSA